MDEEFYTIPPTSLPHGNQPNSTEFLHTNTVSIFVDTEWNGGNTSLEGVIQHCPAIYIPTPLQIPQAVKHIYRCFLKIKNPFSIPIKADLLLLQIH